MADLTYAQLYADLVAATTREATLPENTFTAADFERDTGRSGSWAARELLRLCAAGVLERDKFGHKFYYWFKQGRDDA